MSYSASEVRAFVRAEFREARAEAKRLIERRRIRREISRRLGWNPGHAAKSQHDVTVVRRGGVDVAVVIEIEPLPLLLAVWCECGDRFQNKQQLAAHRWHCQKKRTA